MIRLKSTSQQMLLLSDEEIRLLQKRIVVTEFSDTLDLHCKVLIYYNIKISYSIRSSRFTSVFLRILDTYIQLQKSSQQQLSLG